MLGLYLVKSLIDSLKIFLLRMLYCRKKYHISSMNKKIQKKLKKFRLSPIHMLRGNLIFFV